MTPCEREELGRAGLPQVLRAEVEAIRVGARGERDVGRREELIACKKQVSGFLGRAAQVFEAQDEAAATVPMPALIET